MYQWAFDTDTVTKFRNMHLEETGSQGIIYHVLDHEIRTSLQVSRARYVDIFGYVSIIITNPIMCHNETLY